MAMRERTIGVLMDFLVPGVIDGAGAYAREHGLRIDARWSVRADWLPKEPGWAGILVNLTDSRGILKRVKLLGLPTVHLSGWLDETEPRVDTNYAACAVQAVGEFRELGIRRVAALDLGTRRVNRRSFHGMWVAARRAGLDFVPLPMWPQGEIFPDGMKWIAERVAEIERPCGVFLSHAGLTFWVLDELAARGVRVPEDVAVIVIDKDVQRTAELAPVPLTAVIPDSWQQGYEAARMVHRLMDGERIGKRIVRIGPAGLVRRESTGVETIRDPLVAKVLHGIRELPMGRLSIEQLAAYAGVSRRTLEQRFRRVTGRTLHVAIMRRRISEAKRLLKAGKGTVGQVAQAAGYSSVHYFTTAFKREVGETPGGYRKRRSEG